MSSGELKRGQATSSESSEFKRVQMSSGELHSDQVASKEFKGAQMSASELR